MITALLLPKAVMYSFERAKLVLIFISIFLFSNFGLTAEVRERRRPQCLGALNALLLQHVDDRLPELDWKLTPQQERDRITQLRS
jgi:hypothetical protein